MTSEGEPNPQPGAPPPTVQPVPEPLPPSGWPQPGQQAWPPQGAPQGAPQGTPLGAPQGTPLGAPQGTPLATPPPYGQAWPSSHPGIPGSWPVAPSTELRDPGYASALTKILLGSIVGGALLGVLHAWLWVMWSNPPDAQVYQDGIFLDEQALSGQTTITLWYFVIAAGLGLLAGLVIGWFGRRVGWPTVVAVLVMSAVGAVVSRYLGIHVFGPDPKAAAAHAKVGDLIQIGVQIDTKIAYLGWAIGGLVGALASIAGWSLRRPDGRA